MNTKMEALETLAVAAAHHTEIAELAADAASLDFADTLLDAGDNLDVAIVLAHQHGANLLELKRATGLDVRYLAALTSGTFPS